LVWSVEVVFHPASLKVLLVFDPSLSSESVFPSPS